MNNSILISFILKKSKTDSNGKAPIYARITLNGQRSEFSIKRFIEPTKWLSTTGGAKGNTDEIKALNSNISTIKSRLLTHYNNLMSVNQVVTAEEVKNSYFGITDKGKMLIDVFQNHNKQVKALIGKDFAIGTYERYCTAMKHCKDFLEYKYKLSDIPVKDINFEFINEYEYYLKTVRNCNHNSAIKYITNFKKIIRVCLGNGWIEKDPFINYKIRLNEVEREFLTKSEVQTIVDKEFSSIRLDQVRDIFIFCCFTGLAYADVKKLSQEHIIKGIDGGQWIKINRTKTDTRSSIPLLPTPLLIIEKYSSHIKCIEENTLLPVYSNQKMNEYLKEIASVCSISKTITFHIARHTFATTITLTNNVPIESVSKMLGHKSIRTTQHYAKVVDRKISEDMLVLKEKIRNQNGLNNSNEG